MFSILPSFTMNVTCVRCGRGQLLAIENLRAGFLMSGWQADFSQPERPTLVCENCAGGRATNDRRDYLQHIFEAQKRFGE